MNQLLLLFKLNLTIRIDNPSQEREFRMIMKKEGIRVPMRDTYAYEDEKKGKKAIYPIFFSLKERNEHPIIFWDVKEEYVKDTTIIKLKAFKKIKEQLQ